ncbi:MAG: xanthine phosphoribosyltransferase [Oscillospiraceae bacterium]|nr:xanthine phosphoribosyltransferase [Oscillospiraceae bacterium]
MKMLKDRIMKDGIVRAGNVLKVDCFLNHQMDISLFEEMAAEWKKRFEGKNINKILTIEASGIAIAAIVASVFDNCPVVFAKKTECLNVDGPVFSSKVTSFTKKRTYDVFVSQKYLTPEDHVLIVDDFLAVGSALNGLIDICDQSGATIEGLGIAIEKGFQGGGDALREKGYHLESLAIVEKLDAENGIIEFRK